MLAYVMNEEHHLVLRNVEKPKETDENLIVKVHKTSICGTDVRTYSKGSEKITPPRVLGHEFSGVIIHLGKKVDTDFQKGDRVLMAPAIGCGECWSCQTGHPNMCDNLQTIGFQYDGSFTEYIEIPLQALKIGNLIKTPASVTDEEASLIEPIGCALNAQKYINVQEDDYIVVYGAGFIGCMHIELAKIRGASKLIIVEPAEVRARQACEFISEVIWINPLKENTEERVKEITGGRGANVVIVANSVSSCQVEAQKIAAKMGRVSLFGGLVGDSTGFIDSNAIHYKELQVSGVHATTPALMREILEMVEAKKLNLKKYISTEVTLNEIEKGFSAILNDHAMKVVITP